ncbi:MAG: transposase [Spirochaetaceae bacterium]|nr:transposase [Spirochaetaceae bacterium]
MLIENQEAVIQIPRGWNGTFAPKIVTKYQKRIPLFNNQIISMRVLGMTDRNIKAHCRLTRRYSSGRHRPLH